MFGVYVSCMSLDGYWETGIDRNYDRVVKVPGLAGDPGKMDKGSVWYKRQVDLPGGNWTGATLIMNGARFCPEIHINNRKVSESSGGMTVTSHLLTGPEIKPGRSILLEIALKSLMDVAHSDVSRIPDADLWRSNISSCLWDSVSIRFHGPSRITRLIPFPDIQEDRLSVYWEFENITDSAGGIDIRLQVTDKDGCVLAESVEEEAGCKGRVMFDLHHACEPWSPDRPVCYRLWAVLESNGKIVDQYDFMWGLKEFRTKGLKFVLNNQPVTLRAGSVVWHRWTRDPEARELAFDTGWFEKNIVLRLKSHGANTLRFHLGPPPEALLDLCDKHGLMVQMEWIFFHGMKASKESLVEQWRNWFDLCIRHPSVCIIHPWNETDEKDLDAAYNAIEELSDEYPPLVISHRDVIHVHNYWWSLFENLGLYYDSAGQFDKPVMADEFGGNYLDGECDPGRYPTLKESFLRFLGYGHTKDQRLRLHTESNTRIAEYWRRIGAAGFSPFCILGSPEDGNHHFLGKLEDAIPKPVWAGLTAAYSPLSLSIDVWDRNYIPGREVRLPLYFFNDSNEKALLSADVQIADQGDSHVESSKHIDCEVPAFSSQKEEMVMKLPNGEGEWQFQAVLQNSPGSVLHPVVSSWRFRTLQIRVPEDLYGVKIAVPDQDRELTDFLNNNRLNICSPGSMDSKIFVTSSHTWDEIMAGTLKKGQLERAIENGCSVVMLDAGPMSMGQGQMDGANPGFLKDDIGTVNTHTVEVGLFHGIKAVFRELPEPESCIHPPQNGSGLWENLDRQAACLWNGLRGGLVAPAYNMEVQGLSPSAFLSLWTGRGADAELVKKGSCFAYELQGFYAFSEEKDEGVINKLRSKVRFLVEDAPALKLSIDPDAPVIISDLALSYRESLNSRAKAFIPLAVCGRNLNRTPVIKVEFGQGKGKLILSQLFTRGRLADGYGQEGHYGIRYDPVAVQFVLNMLKNTL